VEFQICELQEYNAPFLEEIQQNLHDDLEDPAVRIFDAQELKVF